MKKGRLVTHGDTDGVVSGTMMYAISTGRYSEIKITDYEFINHKRDDLRFNFEKTDVVVDLPQPNIAVRFWADHHGTGMRFGVPKHAYLYDKNAPSCGGLLYRHFKDKHSKLSRFEELVIGCDMVDSAGYKKPEDIHDMTNYAVRIKHAMKAANRGYADLYWKPVLIEKLAKAGDWRKVLDDPFVTSMASYTLGKERQYEEAVDTMIELVKNVIVLDTVGKSKLPGYRSRYYPFVKHQDATYLLTISAGYGKTTVSVSENPFLKNGNGVHPNQRDLGKLAQNYDKNGGGHKGIGVIPSIKAENKDELKAELLELLNSES